MHRHMVSDVRTQLMVGIEDEAGVFVFALPHHLDSGGTTGDSYIKIGTSPWLRSVRIGCQSRSRRIVFGRLKTCIFSPQAHWRGICSCCHKGPEESGEGRDDQ